MPFHMTTCGGLLLGALGWAGVSVVAAQMTEPIVGTWKLDPAKSSYKPGPSPRSTTITITPAAKGLTVAIETVNADGSPLEWGFTTRRDGVEEARVTGNPLFDVVTSTREGATAGTNVYKKAGKVVMTTTIAISADGRSMTVKASGVDARGQPLSIFGLYTKQ
jgi:hypothetical protein